MIKKTFSVLVFALGAMALLTSCDKDDSTSPEGKTITIDARSYSEWKYFSFDEDTIVPIDDFSTSMNWDIAFHRSDIRVNCGQAGLGQGGSYCVGKVDFKSVTEAPADGYSLNTTISILESYIMPPTYVTVPGDTLVSKWLTIVTSNTAPPTYVFNDNIYIIRTASGKYAKVWLKDYFDENSTGGYVQMMYSYQSDGSRSF
ncbi:MAG: HmuY family protein [Bacteroidales bacterium]